MNVLLVLSQPFYQHFLRKEGLYPESYTRPLVRAELNLSLASTLLPLPSTAPTVRAFVADVQSGKVVLP